MRYAILTTPRTGGRALCDCLAQTGVAGMVGKDGGLRGNELYIGTGEALAQIDIKRAVDEFFAANRTPNGVEGVKINFPYLMTLQKWVGWEPVEAIVRSLDYAVILERDDNVAQAVSLYFARQTGAWSSHDQDQVTTLTVDYDYDKILSLLARIEMGKRWIRTFVAGCKIRRYLITYEYLVKTNWGGAIAIMLVDMNISIAPVVNVQPRLKQLHDPRKQAFIERFREEAANLDKNLV